MASREDAIKTISNAIAYAEGYGIAGKIPTRNNNPGDIKDNGQNNPNGYPTDYQGHIIYPSADQGWAALRHQVGLMVTPGANSAYNPNMTIEQVSELYAGDSAAWLNNVTKKLGVGKDTTLNDTMTLLQTGQLPTDTTQPNPAASGQQTAINDVLHRPDATFVPLVEDPTQTNTNYALLPPDVVILQGLDEVAWYDDPGLIVGNRPGRNRVTPISFNIILNDNAGPFMLSSQGKSGTPIDIQLNCSLKNSTITMRHLFHNAPSRTGQHITFWGMQADVITGTATTGVRMNQLGLTDFMSVAGASQELIDLVNSGFQHTSASDVSQPDFDEQGNILDTSPDVFTQTVKRNTNRAPSSFRVAAEDAFVEFLKMFQNNATVWFYNADYNEQLTEQHAGTDAWSPATGMSQTQANARNNDVMTRGSVVMKTENNSYQGYFKSLSWVQDANNPFQWNFNFVFQVERTSTVLYYPR